MEEIRKVDLELIVKELSENHIKFIGYAKQAHRELDKNMARLFEALSFSKQVQALSILNHMGVIGKTKENLSVLTGSREEDDLYKDDIYSDISEITSQFDKIEEKNKVLYLFAKNTADAGKDINIGNISVCSKCGDVLVSDATEECAVCHSPSGYFRLF